MQNSAGPMLVVARGSVLVNIHRCHGALAQVVAETIADTLVSSDRVGTFHAWVTPGATDDFLEVRLEHESGVSRAFVLKGDRVPNIVDEVRQQVSLLPLSPSAHPPKRFPPPAC
jgi:hypothetical protein